MSLPFIGYDGDPYPLQPGLSVHECVGTVVASRSERFKEGDFVLALPDRHDGLVEYNGVERGSTHPAAGQGGV